jgi:CDP-2,3-bis-(O-geranylgeranyl)-sn-glycerol synthase
VLLELELFFLLVFANGAPVLASKWLKHRFDQPIDGGGLWRDGRRVLGASKTWRGLVAGCLTTGLLSALAGSGWWFGILFGLMALLGDMLSSFIKRRRGLASSARATGLDQIPEAFLPMLLAVWWLPVQLLPALAVAALFVIANIALSPLLFRLGIRKKPH